MTFTSTDCNTVRMIDTTCFSPGIGSPLTAFSAMPSTSLTAASASEGVGVWEFSAAGSGGKGQCERNRSLNRLIIQRKSDDPIQNAIYVRPS